MFNLFKKKDPVRSTKIEEKHDMTSDTFRYQLDREMELPAFLQYISDTFFEEHRVARKSSTVQLELDGRNVCLTDFNCNMKDERTVLNHLRKEHPGLIGARDLFCRIDSFTFMNDSGHYVFFAKSI